MRMSCNGCRVLRKGCSDNCSIRPCLQWIKNPESQANATVFLAKFYGRAGLLNLINTGPAHLRPAIFRSLLYEACGRIVNPIYGSVGLLWSGSWQLCQAAVESILKGAPVAQIPADAATAPAPPLKPYDIRHISKGGGDLHKVARRRNRFKRSAANSSLKLIPDWAAMDKMDGANGENFGTVEASADTMEGSHVSQGEQGSSEIGEEEEVGLELTLGLEPAAARQPRNAGVRCGFELEQETQKGGKFV